MGGGWVVDKTKIMLSQLQTEVELKYELSLAMMSSKITVIRDNNVTSSDMDLGRLLYKQRITTASALNY